MKRTLGILLLFGLFAVGCGGGDDGGGPTGPPPPTGGNSFTGTIDGTAWKSDAGTIQVTGSGSPTRAGTLVITGFQASSGRGMILTLSFIIGAASQPLGVNPGTNPGGTGSVLISSDTWLTPLSGAAGTVNITVRTDKRIAGTFNFGADALVPGTLPATRTVTGGAFDITLSGGLPDLPTGVGSTSTALVGGQPWNGATIIGLNPGPGSFSIGATTTAYSINFTTGVPITTADSYAIGPEIQVQIIEVGTANSWAAVTGPDVGTFNITYIAADRVIANFNGSIPKVGGGTALTLANGTLNAYLEN